jgi:hypothetical protein
MRRRGWGRLAAAGSLVVGAIAVGWVSPVAADPVNASPSTVGMPGAGLWQQVLGWVMQWGLWLSLTAIVLGAGGWWISGSTGSYAGASRGKQFVVGGAIGALVIGLAPSMVNLLFNAGRNG